VLATVARVPAKGRQTSAEPAGAAAFVPVGTDLDGLSRAAASCQGCHLYANATQTVFSSGPVDARVVLVGEQPGDVEDQRGEPFVGPAGRLLHRAVAEVGLPAESTYTTNAVKHFKFTSAGGGKRRIHATPDAYEVTACRPWLVAELALLDPELVVVLGATAARALLGPAFRVTRSRGTLMPWPASAARPEDFGAGEDGARRAAFSLATIHPSAVLRAQDQDEAYAGFVADLRTGAQALAG
jgi:DNA polymerase